MSWFLHFFSGLGHLFDASHKAKIEAAAQSVEALLPFGAAIVRDIDELAPNRTLAQFNSVALKYAVPTIAALGEGQTVGNVALNLGSAILQKNHAPEAGMRLLNTVIQLAAFAAQPPAPVKV
jgi:hypothetical protein